MIGNNTMEVNESTMIAAFQLYLESIMKSPCPLKVTSITVAANTTYGNTFFVKVEETAKV